MRGVIGRRGTDEPQVTGKTGKGIENGTARSMKMDMPMEYNGCTLLHRMAEDDKVRKRNEKRKNVSVQAQQSNVVDSNLTKTSRTNRHEI